MYAIIETCGKQYKLAPGDLVHLDRLPGAVGETIQFKQVLLVGGRGDTAEQTLVGKPYVAQALLSGEIVQQGRGPKILTIKYKRRKDYRRKIGHRSEISQVLITKIEDGTGKTLEVSSEQKKASLLRASVALQKKEKPVKKAAATTVKAKTANTEKKAPAQRKPAASKTAGTAAKRKKTV